MHFRTARGATTLIALLLTVAAAPAQVFGDPRPTAKDQRVASWRAGGLAGLPLLFVANRDRYSDPVRYHVEHPDGALLVTDAGIVFRDHGRDDPGRVHTPLFAYPLEVRSCE